MVPSLIQRNDDPPDEPDPACEVCCFEAGSCICPPCEYCGERGVLACYETKPGFRLSITKAQAIARIRYRAHLYREAAEREGQYAEWLDSTPGGEISPHIEDYPTTI